MHIRHITFRVKDIEKSIEFYQTITELALGKNLLPSDIQCPDDGTRYFYVYDPDGVSVQLRAW